MAAIFRPIKNARAPHGQARRLTNRRRGGKAGQGFQAS